MMLKKLFALFRRQTEEKTEIEIRRVRFYQPGLPFSD